MDISELISQFDALVSSKPSRSLPSPIQMYRVGLAFYHLQLRDETNYRKVSQLYQNFLERIPPQEMKTAFLDPLSRAYERVVAKSNLGDVTTSTQALCGLYRSSKEACRAGYSPDLCVALSQAYANIKGKNSDENDHDTLLRSILSTLSDLLHYGLLVGPDTIATDANANASSDGEEGSLRKVMEAVQALIADDTNTCLGDMLQQQSDSSIVKDLQNRFADSAQLDYLIHMVESAPKSSDTIQSTLKQQQQKQKQKQKRSFSGAPASSQPARKVDPREEIQRRIRQVQDVLPHLGDGYVETALANFQGDISKTVTALFEGETNPSSLPDALQVLDKQLPARKPDTTPSTYNTQNDTEARDIAKQRLADMEAKQEREALALSQMHSEYNDDYDDQYDDMEGAAGSAAGGTYDDVDLDAIRTYNRVARDAEREDKFWQENRNTNRRGQKPQKVSSTAGDDDENDGGPSRKYRGPDKIRGGRVLGPDGKVLPKQRGGKKGKQQQQRQQQQQKQNDGTDSNGMTKLQKRRKNDNKSKIGNHHRKDRAQKKAASGM